MSYVAELTDTFGGDANYSWVRRATIQGETKRQLLKDAREKLELGSVKLRKAWDTGECMRYDLDKCCICLFITWEDQ